MLEIEPLRAHLQERWGVGLRISDEAKSHLVQRARADHGGRGLLNAVERDLMNPLSLFLFDHLSKLRKGRSIEVILDKPILDFRIVNG